MPRIPNRNGVVAKGLEWLFSKLEPVPDEWLKESEERQDDPTLEPLACTEYREMINAWRRALKWTEGLDQALSVMLACSASTTLVGEQLWIKILGPPSCLDGDTPIHDPVDGTILTIKQRWEKGEKFSVWTKESDGSLGVTEALPPQREASTTIYEVEFSDGEKLRCTENHRIWAGSSYRTVQDISESLQKGNHLFVPCPEVVDSERGITISGTVEIIKVSPVKEDYYYDFSVPETQNYLACGVFHHNCGKTTILEGLAIDRRHVLSKDSIRGFYQGWKTEDGSDLSIASLARGKTLATKDGDTLLRAPNLQQILSEARGLYDRVGRTHYRNAVMHDYEGHRMTWLLCGTAALREIDESELGNRFLDCVVMDAIDDDFEDDVAWRAVNQEAECMLVESNGKPEDQHPKKLAFAMRLTGGYLEYLRENVVDLLNEVGMGDGAKRQCAKLGKFVAYMRARPNKVREDAEATREFSARLAKQHVRLARMLAVVLQRDSVDGTVMDRVKRVALDTSRGQTLVIAGYLRKASDGMEARALESYLGLPHGKSGKLLRFLRQIGALESFTPVTNKGVRKRVRWRLTERLTGMYDSIVGVDWK